MKTLVIICPNTGKQVSTGIMMSTVAGSSFSNNALWCSRCGRKHQWGNADAFLVDSVED